MLKNIKCPIETRAQRVTR